MATFSKRYNNWHARVRKNNKVITKTFRSKKNAIRWAKKIELKIEKGIFEDLSQANTISLKEILQEYLAQVTMKKKGWSIVEIAQQGGWKELRVLKRYTHLKPEYLADKLKQI